jgi:hypothetical protein
MTMPAAPDSPETYETFFWLNGEGDLLGTATYIAAEMADRLADSYVATTESPEVGMPHVPARIRVASEAHAAALRRAVGPETEVVCAPTPEVEPVRISLAAYLDKVGSPVEESYLSSTIGPEVVAGLFGAAARLYVAAPWRQLPSDQAVASVSIRALGVRKAALVVPGKDGSVPGVLLFSNGASVSDYRRILLEEPGGEDEAAPIPPHVGLEFARGADIDPGRRKEIAKHGWKVAGPVAYPEINAIDEDGMMRPATSRELAVLESIASALVRIVEEQPALLPRLANGEPFQHSVDVETHAARSASSCPPPSPKRTPSTTRTRTRRGRPTRSSWSASRRRPNTGDWRNCTTGRS